MAILTTRAPSHTQHVSIPVTGADPVQSTRVPHVAPPWGLELVLGNLPAWAQLKRTDTAELGGRVNHTGVLTTVPDRVIDVTRCAQSALTPGLEARAARPDRSRISREGSVTRVHSHRVLQPAAPLDPLFAVFGGPAAATLD